MSDTPFNLSLPDDESYIETVPIADEFSITAELPTMEGIIRYMEKEALAPHGYYRLVKHPYNRAVELNFEKEYSFKEAILYCSAQSALRELLDLLQSQLKFETLSVMPTAPMRQRHWEKRFSRLQIKSTFDINFAEEAGVVIYKFHEKPETTKICIYYSESFDSPDKIPTDTDYAIIALPGDEGAVLLTNQAESAEIIYDRNKKRGAMISARALAPLLGKNAGPKATDDEVNTTMERLKELAHASYVNLYPSGMNAVATALDLYKKPGKNHFIIIGHVYSDSHFMITEVPWRGEEAEFVFIDSNHLHEIEPFMEENTCCILVETITNPLLEVPDIAEICKKGLELNIPVIVDNTMASPFNFRPLDYGATLSIESTTKYLSGNNRHGGGAIFSNDPLCAARLNATQTTWANTLSAYEIPPLAEGLKSYEQRMQRFNKNGQRVAEFLEQQPEIETVYFAGLATSPYHDTAKKLLHGFGSVVSFVLKNENLAKVNAFYEADLGPIKKAPSLGSDLTLMCPYVLLTYYHKDDDYLKTIPLSRYLIRIAVGCEDDLQTVLDGLKSGLESTNHA